MITWKFLITLFSTFWFISFAVMADQPLAMPEDKKNLFSEW